MDEADRTIASCRINDETLHIILHDTQLGYGKIRCGGVLVTSRI